MTNFVLPEINILSVLPEIILLMAGTVLLFMRKLSIKLSAFSFSVSVAAILGQAVFLTYFWNRPISGFNGVIVWDNRTLIFFFLIIAAALLALIFSHSYLKDEEKTEEYYFLILLATVGMILMVTALDMMIVFFGMEILSVSLYALVGILRKTKEELEAAIKYFLLGSFASAVFLMGLALIYGASGQTNLNDLYPATIDSLDMLPVLYIGVVLIIVGLGFKIAAVPFHMWAPDTYEGAPASVAALLSVAPKIAAFAVICRLGALMNLYSPQMIMAVIMLMSAGSMIIGNFAALQQVNLIRMLAYSGIAQIGYVLIGILALGQGGGATVLFYLFVYVLMNMGAFGIAVLLTREKGGKIAIDDLAGLAARHPILAFAMTVFMISLAGIPPTGGFFAKFYVFKLGIEAGHFWIVIIAIIASIVSLYYYFRVIVAMYMREEAAWIIPREKRHGILIVALIVCAFLLLLTGIFSERLINLSTIVL